MAKSRTVRPEVNNETPAAEDLVVENKTVTTGEPIEPKDEPSKSIPTGVPLSQFNPGTHVVVNKARFEQMCVCMVSQRTKPYLKMSMATRLAELMELPGGDNEARELITGMFARVANG